MKSNKDKKISINDFFKLPVKEREKIMSEIAGEANEDQRALVRKYDREFGKKAASGC